MNELFLVRLPINAPRLLRFAAESGIRQEDETWGYTFHAWLSALFGVDAPKPFRFMEKRNELLAYSRNDAVALLEQARAFAAPHAWAALTPEAVASKPMPGRWEAGKRVRLEVLACPVSRTDSGEKDVYLRALDRTGDATPPRAEVYRNWFARQCEGVVHLESVDVLGIRARARMLRRARNGNNCLRVVERPEALLGAQATITSPEGFVRLLTRGIGRHRAFGYGMVLLSPPR